MTRKEAIRNEPNHPGRNGLLIKREEFQQRIGLDRYGNRHAFPEAQQTRKGVGRIFDLGIVERTFAWRIVRVGMPKKPALLRRLVHATSTRYVRYTRNGTE